MNTAAVTSLARNVWTDLREKRLWPLALALLLVIVAVPVLLMHSPAAPPPAAPVASTGVAPPGIPAVSAQSSTQNSRLSGGGRDPFGHSASAGTTGGTATPAAGVGTSSATGSPTSNGTGSAGTTGPASSGSGTSSPGTAVSTPVPAGGAPPPPVPANKPAPAPTGLTSTQSYAVSLSMTNASGGLNSVDSLERLSLLPSSQQPMLIELGVLQGGHRALFAVAPGTVLRGPGICVPGPIDCEILSLAANQIEAVSTDVGSAPTAMFAITGISAVDHRSAGAAQQARQSVSLAGSQFLSRLPLSALQLFPFDTSVGALVDVRNLRVGGN